MDLKLLAEILNRRGIQTKYENANTMVISGITVLFSGNMLSFGTVRARFHDAYSFLTVLQSECLITLPYGEKSEIEREYLVCKNAFESV